MANQVESFALAGTGLIVAPCVSNTCLRSDIDAPQTSDSEVGTPACTDKLARKPIAEFTEAADASPGVLVP